MTALPAPPTPEPAAGRWLGSMRFADALALQLRTRDALAAGEAEPTVFGCEHPAVLTLGRRGERTDIRWSAAELAQAGVEVCESPRGGQVTLHGPGQLVIYPVVRIGWRIRAHITSLGEAAAALLAELGVPDPEFRIEQPGVWIGPRKIASIGVHVSRGIAVQGIAINLDVEPTLFSALVSCGLEGVAMTSAVHEGAQSISAREAAARFVMLWSAHYGSPVAWPPG